MYSGKYSTNESECRVRFQKLKQRYALVLPRLNKWITGQEAGNNKDLNDQGLKSNHGRNNHQTQHGTTAYAEVATRRYMPSTIKAAVDANGYAEWEEIKKVPKESSKININVKMLKLGIVDKHSMKNKGKNQGGKLNGHLSNIDNEIEEKNKLKLVNEERKTRSVFSK